MSTAEITTPAAIARLCFQKFKELPKSGKPTDTQWSVLAGIVLHDSFTQSMRVVSIGLGTKCIGASKMCPKGLIVNDSHAEVVARRGLLRFLYNELLKLSTTSTTSTKLESIFEWHQEKCRYELKLNFSFHFFCTQPPCGDACIIASEHLNKAEDEDAPPTKLRRLSDSIESSIVYTGAKLIIDDVDDVVDAQQRDRMAQVLGALRIKPGKGDRTLSMSCSDKLSKWCVMGIQGALLDALLARPIYLSSLNFCANANIDALSRAIYKRWTWCANFGMKRYRQHVPLIQICEDAALAFEYQQTSSRQQPAPAAISWCELPQNLRPCEILVDGKRQGCTKKSLDTPRAAVHISKYQLFLKFIAVLSSNEALEQNLLQNQDLCGLSYRDAKRLAKTYQNAWHVVKCEYFGQWTKKPENFEQFYCT